MDVKRSDDDYDDDDACSEFQLPKIDILFNVMHWMFSDEFYSVQF